MASPNTPLLRIGFFLTHFGPGGIERIVLNLLQRLDRERFAPFLILSRRSGRFLAELPPDITVIDLAGRRASLSVPRLAGILRSSHIDLAMAATSATNLALIAAARLVFPRTAVVIAEHTPVRFSIENIKWRWLRRTLMRQLYPLADRIITPVLPIAEELTQELRSGRVSISVLNNPLFDFKELSCRDFPQPKLFEGLPAPVFVAAGRFSWEKGFDILCRTWLAVRKHIPSAQLVLLGDGLERSKLETILNRNGERSSVHFAGMVSNPWDYFQHADAVVMTSRTEAFPSVLLESMAVGTPVVAVDCPVGPRLVTDNGSAGLLVPRDNTDALVDALSRIANDETLRRRMIENGLKQAHRFDLGSTISAYQDLFLRVAAERHQ